MTARNGFITNVLESRQRPVVDMSVAVVLNLSIDRKC